jgi:hypothetical protein
MIIARLEEGATDPSVVTAAVTVDVIKEKRPALATQPLSELSLAPANTRPCCHCSAKEILLSWLQTACLAERLLCHQAHQYCYG